MAGKRLLNDRFTFLTDSPVPVSVSSLTQAGGTATANTGAPHGFNDGDFVTIAGATPSAYNGEVQVSIIDADTFTYAVSGNPSSPATGTITATFKSDAQGGQGQGWRTHVTVSGHLHPLSVATTLQAQAVNSVVGSELEIEYRPDIVHAMRVQYTPYRHTTPKTLEILGVKPHKDFPNERLLLDVGEVQ